MDAHLRFAVLGDVEPKPDPEYTWLPRAVEVINDEHAHTGLAFVAGVGDVAHNGTPEQYAAATACLSDLDLPFYAIMGNEELNEPISPFLSFARAVNADANVVPDIQYVKPYGGYRFVFASPLIRGRGFTTAQLNWIEAQVRHSTEPVIGIVHAAPQGVLPDGRHMPDRRFDRVAALPALQLVFSGHSHLDVERCQTMDTDEWGTRHVHIPGIERTKVGDGHTPRFAFVEIDETGTVDIRYYNLETDAFESALGHQCSIKPPRRAFADD